MIKKMINKINNKDTEIIQGSQTQNNQKEVSMVDFYREKFGDTADTEICILLNIIIAELKKQNEELDK